MKKIILLFVMCLSVFSLSAQTGEAIYVYRNDSVFNSFLRMHVDSITYSPFDMNGTRHDEMVTQTVWTEDGICRIPLSAIDSVMVSKYGNPGEAVDLGLSVKWANCNVGASKPEDFGGYYAWGETEEKSVYKEASYKYYNPKNEKYLNLGTYISGTQYDVARVKWGSSWRMPTSKELTELCDKCTWESKELNGVHGLEVTGPNGNRIFLPAAGYLEDIDADEEDTNADEEDTNIKGKDLIYYWSSTVDGSDMSKNMYAHEYWQTGGSRSPRYQGFSVRPVAVEKKVVTGSVPVFDHQSAFLLGTVTGTTLAKKNVSAGVFYSTEADPSKHGMRVAVDSVAEGVFSVFLSGLETGATYYYCAYLCLDSIYTYGEVKQFKTADSILAPVHAIDLGLSVKWANCNVGASKPEEFGGYYAWGEMEDKSVYSKETYKYYNKENDTYIDIGDSISGTQYDVAHVKWGGTWRMPTRKELEELCDKCVWIATAFNGVKGQVVTGPNGNSIFLPAARCFFDERKVVYEYYNNYWSGSQMNDSAFVLNFSDDYCTCNVAFVRHTGIPVRPVTK